MDFLQNLAILVSIGAVFYNIRAWHRELRGKRNIELAEEVLALFYEAKDAILWMRHLAGFADETDSIKKNDNEDEKEFNARKKASKIFVRYNQNKEIFSKIHSLKYRFMAQIGKGKAKPFEDLDRIISEIISSAHLLSMLWPEREFVKKEEKDAYIKDIKAAERVFWNTYAADDPINPKVDMLMMDIEAICRDVIMAKNTFWLRKLWNVLKKGHTIN